MMLIAMHVDVYRWHYVCVCKWHDVCVCRWNVCLSRWQLTWSLPVCASEMAVVMFVYTGDMIIFVCRSHGVYRWQCGVCVCRSHGVYQWQYGVCVCRSHGVYRWQCGVCVCRSHGMYWWQCGVCVCSTAGDMFAWAGDMFAWTGEMVMPMVMFVTCVDGMVMFVCRSQGVYRWHCDVCVCRWHAESSSGFRQPPW